MDISWSMAYCLVTGFIVKHKVMRLEVFFSMVTWVFLTI